MGKRSDFERRAMDDYPTPPEAVTALLHHIPVGTKFCEPCAGEGKLIETLERAGMVCVSAFDAAIGPHPRADVSFMTRENLGDADMIITNPPWDREPLHQIIMRCALMRPTWLLFDADWAHTRQAIPYLEMCVSIVAIGRREMDGGHKERWQGQLMLVSFRRQARALQAGLFPAALAPDAGHADIATD